MMINLQDVNPDNIQSATNENSDFEYVNHVENENDNHNNVDVLLEVTKVSLRYAIA